MAEYDTGRDIVEDILSRAGELSLNLAELGSEAKRYANRGYFTILRDFPWLSAEGYPPLSIVTPAKISVTGVVVINNSAAVTVNETMQSTYANRKLVLDRDGVPLRISDAGQQSIVLAAPFYGVSGSGLTGYIYQDEFSVANVLTATRIKNLTKPQDKIQIIGYEEMDNSYPLSVPFGPISVASFYTEEILRFAMVPESAQLLEMFYSKKPARLDFSGNLSTDTPVIPFDERWLIADYGLYFLLMDHGDDRAQTVAQIVSGRIGEAKNRQIGKMSPRVWLPDGMNINVVN